VLEALISAHVDHPNVAAPIAAGLDHGTAYLAQEYAVGDSLDIVLRERGPMTVQDVAVLVDSLAAAIDHAADRGVHHGLLHLRDIVLSADAARITGFGIAGALSAIGAQLPARPQYSSPAMASDVYSLGAIAFEAATGRRASPDNLSELEAGHGTRLRDAFELALNADASQRPARAKEFADRLRKAAGITGTKGAKGAMSAAGATGATGATGAKGAMGAATAPVAPIAPTAPVAPTASTAPVVPDDPLDRVIDLGEPRHLDVDPSDFTTHEERQPPPRALNRPWSAQPSQELDVFDHAEPEPGRRMWPIAVTFVAVAIIAALSVGWFLRSRAARSTTETPAGVDSTIIDLPAAAPASPGASASAPPARNASADKSAAKPAPIAPNAPIAPAPSSAAVESAPTGSVLIRSTPADADVLVNGKPRGKTPLTLRDLALGSYTIRVARDGYATEERTLQLTERRPTTSTTINLRSAGGNANTTRPGLPAKAMGDASAAAGGLNVQSRPAGARVFVNDRLAGSTPIAIPGLPAGSTTVRIELDGYQPWTTTVRVGAGGQTRVAASLERK